ncbi:hypothetical protein MLD38_002035 [Melastoma candidum]|uniref:Uncharacterized protein n=1 Tax=Melastoma candidum TaxID=119954 RepID=A0ACB9SH60_9MYRT|nr:hypothetical protein MLD38_002035 [Melastoma candidum]
MSVSASDCSKGCESGWTVYLNESWPLSPEEWHSSAGRGYPREDGFYRGRTKDEEEEGENLSMVSDASSGPPSREVEDDCSNGSFPPWEHRSWAKKKTRESSKVEQHQNYYYYEDTACSTHLKCTEQEKTGSRCFQYNKNSAPAERANSGKKGSSKNRKGA